MFPQVAAKFFGTRDQGPTDLGKDPSSPAARARAPGAEGVRAAITYDVTLGGRTHKVTVTPV